MSAEEAIGEGEGGHKTSLRKNKNGSQRRKKKKKRLFSIPKRRNSRTIDTLTGNAPKPHSSLERGSQDASVKTTQARKLLAKVRLEFEEDALVFWSQLLILFHSH